MNYLHVEEGDDLEVVEFLEFGIPRQIYHRSDYFNTLDEISFRRRFRLSREAVLSILTLIEHRLEFPYDINNCISPINQLLMTLRLYSTGGHLLTIADFGGMHVSTVSRIVQRVTSAIANLYHLYIKLPDQADERTLTQQTFYNVASFPRVVGAVDCTHIKLQSPGGEDAEVYRNRKQYFSVNTQAVCNAQLKLLNVVARWPGSVHDSNIFNHSNLKRDFENNIYPNCLLIGDSGYPCKTYLLTPILHPTTQPEQLYNESLVRTRNCIERCFGLLKRRFPILAYGCRLQVPKVLGVIIACGVLHNVALEMGDIDAPPIPEELDEHVLQRLIDDGQIPDVVQYNPDAHINAGDLTRRQLIQQHFSQL